MTVAVLHVHGWRTFDTSLVVIANGLAIIACIVYIGWRAAKRDADAREERDEFRALLTDLRSLLLQVEDTWKYQHAQGTYVGTLRGLWHVLEQGAETGGLDLTMRQAIYRAGDEMFDAFYAATGIKEVEGDPLARRHDGR